MRKGQVTLFVIIGIVLLITVTIFLAIKPKTNNISTLSTNTDQKQIEFMLSECLQQTLDESIYYAAATAFFTIDQTNAIVNNIPIFHLYGENIFPGDKEIGTRYGNYLEIALSECVQIDSIKNQELILEENPYEVKVIFTDDQIKATAEIKGKLIDEKSTRKISDVTASTTTSLAYLYAATKMVASSTLDNPFCVECMDQYATEKNFYGVATYGPTEGTIEFTFVDFEEQLELNFLVAP